MLQVDDKKVGKVQGHKWKEFFGESPQINSNKAKKTDSKNFTFKTSWNESENCAQKRIIWLIRDRLNLYVIND